MIGDKTDKAISQFSQGKIETMQKHFANKNSVEQDSAKVTELLTNIQFLIEELNIIKECLNVRQVGHETVKLTHATPAQQKLNLQAYIDSCSDDKCFNTFNILKKE